MTLDINLLRSVVTLFSFAVFIGLIAWVCSGKRRAGFDEAAALPFAAAADDGTHTHTNSSISNTEPRP
jgi:cytochrome c oxidase cbb3-type subunit IV